MSTIHAHSSDCNCTDCTNERPTNYVQPHEHAKWIPELHNRMLGVSGDKKFQVVTAFLVVYVVHRCFGGREEGGWWYDAYEFTGASFPFQAVQEFEAQVIEGDDVSSGTDDTRQLWYDEETKEYKAWVPVGLPYVMDEPTRVRLASVRAHFETLYPTDTRHRFSCAQRDEDYTYSYELHPGEMEKRERPRYC